MALNATSTGPPLSLSAHAKTRATVASSIWRLQRASSFCIAAVEKNPAKPRSIDGHSNPEIGGIFAIVDLRSDGIGSFVDRFAMNCCSLAAWLSVWRNSRNFWNRVSSWFIEFGWMGNSRVEQMNKNFLSLQGFTSPFIIEQIIKIFLLHPSMMLMHQSKGILRYPRTLSPTDTTLNQNTF